MASIKRPSPQLKPINQVHDPYYDTPAWRRKRKYLFGISNLCDYCKAKGIAKIAKYLDHLLNRRMWPELEDDDSNLRRACTACDNRKRQLESRHRDKINLVNALQGGGFYP